ncbi:MAG: hypothetical protein QM731_12695 [Chitinophagaceae bacterium]
MTIILRLVFPILCFLFIIPQCKAQQILNGKYIGLEKITVTPDGTMYWPGIYNFGPRIGKMDSSWYHETTIIVTDTSIVVEKRPLSIKNGIVTYSDSTGGFYFYKTVSKKAKDSSWSIMCSLETCKYCPHTATATPRYIHVFYTIHPGKTDWLIDTEFEKGLLFRKQE